MAECRHESFRFEPDGLPFPSGREVCLQCGAVRVIDGDHTGPWGTAAGDPSEARPPGSRPTGGEHR